MGMDPVTIGIGASVLGGLAGSQGSGGGTTTTSSSSNPWEPQQDYLKYGFSSAKDALGNALQNPTYTGQRVAGLNPFQTSGANWLGNITQGQGFGNANLINNASANMLNGGAAYSNNANAIFNRASQDPTQSILSTANAYASSPYADGLIDASSRDVTRNLYENQLPGAGLRASGTGNTNSTRAGVESAILQRGAADRLTDLSSSIRSNLFNTGLAQGQSQYNQNLTNMLGANSGLLNSFSSGLTGLGAGQNYAAGNFDALNAAGGLYQTQDQNQLNANLAQFNEANQNPLSYIQQYMSTVGGNYGGTSSGSSTAPTVGGGVGGALTGALGGGLGAFGTMGKLKGTGVFGL